MATPSSPTARRFELARRLKELREQAGRSLADVAEELACSLAKASRIETGQRAVQALDIKVLCRFYGVSPTVQQELMSLASEARKRGWWQDFRGLDDLAQTYIGLESAAKQVRSVEILRLPGLLQTPDYAREWITNFRTPGFWDSGVVEDIVAARLRRQERVRSGDLELHVLIDESALSRYRPSDVPVMNDQIRRLIDTFGTPNVRIQVIPLAAGPHPGLDGQFQLLRFREGLLNDIVFVEAQFGNLILEKQETVTQYSRVFEYLSQEVALSQGESLSWLQQHQRHLGRLSLIRGIRSS